MVYLVTRNPFLLLFFILIVPFNVLGQRTNTPSSEQASELLDPIYGVDQRLVSGPFYSGPPRGSVTGDAYFIDDSWKKGSVTMGSLSFDNVYLKYDIEKNQLILRFNTIRNAELQISLKKENIDNFKMDGRLFVPYPGTYRFDSLRFCEVVANGKINFLLMKKKVLSVSGGGTTDYFYNEYINQYLQIENRLIPFKNKRTLYKLFPVHRQELKEYIRSKRLPLWKKNISERTALINYCNQLFQ